MVVTVWVVAVGISCLLLAYLVSELGAILQLAYSLFGVLGGPLLGLFTLGMLFPWANKWGALTGLLGSLSLMLWIALGTRFEKVVVTPPSPLTTSGCLMNLTIANATQVEQSEPLGIYKVSYMWYSGMATLFVIFKGLIVSFITGYTKPETLDPRLICPVFDVFFPYLPENLRKKLRFGVRHGKESSEFKDYSSKNEKDLPYKIGHENKAMNFDNIGINQRNGEVSHNSKNSPMDTKL